MAHIYVDSNAAGAGTGADWTNAYTTVKAAAEAAGTAAGDNIWVAHDHAETTASALTITNKNTVTAPGTIICVNKAGTVPPVAADLRTTATVTTTAASAMSLLGVANGMTYWHGIIFSIGTGAVASILTVGAANVGHRFVSCQLNKLGTTAAAASISHDFSGVINLENTTLNFGNTGDGIRAIGPRWQWLDTATAITGAAIPVRLFAAVASAAYPMSIIRGVDLSAAIGTLVSSGTAGQTSPNYVFYNCKLNSATIISAPQTSVVGSYVSLVSSDSTATNYRTENHRHAGTQYTETAVFRAGGATDGARPLSWRIVTTADTKWANPYESLPISLWSDTTGSHTVTVYGYWNSGGAPTNAEIWIEVEYLGSAASPLSSFASSGKANYLALAADNTTDTTSTWGGGDTTTRFTMAVPFTTAMKGIVTIRIKVGRGSSTFYVDPKVVLT